MKRIIAIFLSVCFISFFCYACSTDKNKKMTDLSFQIDDSSITVSPQTIKATDALEPLLFEASYPDGYLRMQPVITFTLTTQVDSVTVYDFYMDMETLLFKKTLEKAQDNEYKYTVPHSSLSPNNPYGYNEVEDRGFVFIITIANVRCAYPFKVSLDGSHL